MCSADVMHASNLKGCKANVMPILTMLRPALQSLSYLTYEYGQALPLQDANPRLQMEHVPVTPTLPLLNHALPSDPSHDSDKCLQIEPANPVQRKIVRLLLYSLQPPHELHDSQGAAAQRPSAERRLSTSSVSDRLEARGLRRRARVTISCAASRIPCFARMSCTHPMQDLSKGDHPCQSSAEYLLAGLPLPWAHPGIARGKSSSFSISAGIHTAGGIAVMHSRGEAAAGSCQYPGLQHACSEKLIGAMMMLRCNTLPASGKKAQEGEMIQNISRRATIGHYARSHSVMGFALT